MSGVGLAFRSVPGPSPGLPPRRLAWAAFAVLAGAATLALSAAAHRAATFAADDAVARAVGGAGLWRFAPPLHAIDALARPPLVLAAYAVVVLGLLLLGDRWDAAMAGLNAAGGVLLDRLLASLLALPHADMAPLRTAFPAGHVLDVTAFAGFLACLAAMRLRPSSRRTLGVVVPLAALAWFALVRIGHDGQGASAVLGGVLLGALWLAIIMLAHDAGEPHFGETRARRRAVVVRPRRVPRPGRPWAR